MGVKTVEHSNGGSGCFIAVLFTVVIKILTILLAA
jgi:hypothetical protein